MGSGRGRAESMRRATRTGLFMVLMVGSLVTYSASVIVAMADLIVPCVLLSMFTCCHSCYTLKFDWDSYGFRSSLVDVPLLSLVRSFVILCAYYICDVHCLYYRPYIGITVLCALASAVFLIVKVSFFTISEALRGSPTAATIPHFKQSWGILVMFLSSMVLALGHIVVAYRTQYQAARRRLIFQRIDPESVSLSIAALHGYQKVPRMSSPGKLVKVNSEGKMLSIYEERDVPAKMLADNDSLFLLCEGLVIHYKIVCEIPIVGSVIHNSFQDANGRNRCITPGRPTLDNPSKVVSVCRSLNHSVTNQSPHAPLMGSFIEEVTTASQFVYNECFSCPRQVPHLNLVCKHDDLDFKDDLLKPGTVVSNRGEHKTGLDGIVLIHGFGGGVFSWRHIMTPLARLTNSAVVAFDRPGWGLTSRPLRAEWEEKKHPNPYDLRSQVDSLFSFCRELGLFSVVLVGHDDGGLLALMAAAKTQSCGDALQVAVRGVVLVGVNISREVVPAFARVLLHTSLGQHMLRPLLRSEIIQVANRRAWHDASKLTADVLDLYKAPLRVEGWDNALAEVSKLSIGRMLSSNHATDLLKALHGLPVLVAAGADDTLVSLQSSQVLASKFANSRLVAISGCGHLPHEECPKALLAAIVPFVSNLCMDLKLEDSTSMPHESSSDGYR